MAKKQTKSTELTLVQQPEVAELIQKSGIELTKAEAHVMAFAENFKSLAELSRPLSDLNKENPSKEDAKIARETRLKLVKVRTGAIEIKDNRKKILLVEADVIQGAFNLLTKACSLTESQYEEIEKHQERVEEIKRAALKQSRIALLMPFEVDTEWLPLDVMPEDRFQELLSKSKESFEAVKKQREQAEKERIEAERLAEENRLAEIEAEKQRQIERDKENERLKKEAEIKDKRTKELMPLLIMVRDFEGMVNMPEKEYQKELAEIKIGYQQQMEYQYEEKKREEERANAENKAREKEMRRLEIEAEQLQKELQAKKDQEERERQQAISEQQEKEAAEKAKRLAPDKDKINGLYVQIRDFQFPECESDEAKAIITDIQAGFKIILEGIKTKSQTLK